MVAFWREVTLANVPLAIVVDQTFLVALTFLVVMACEVDLVDVALVRPLAALVALDFSCPFLGLVADQIGRRVVVVVEVGRPIVAQSPAEVVRGN